MKQKTVIRRHYTFTQKELKEKLGIIGDIVNLGMWTGQSPNEEAEGKSKDTTTWFIETREEKA